MKYKTKVLFVLLFIFPFKSYAQLNIQFNALNEYMFNTRESMNLMVINSGTKPIKVQFSGKITGQDKGTVVIFKSSPVILNIGTNLITPQIISLETIDYQNYDIEEIEQKTGSYPSGNYTVCIWSACTSPDCDGQGPSAGAIELPVCTNIQIENPTPLILAYPTDNSEILETRPTYTWIPPAPVASSAALNYTMTLVEIYEGQTKSDALAINRPLIEYTGIGHPMLMHPSDLPALEEGKSYAWQVQAYIGQTYFAKSEQWRFKVKKEEEKKKPTGQQYVILKVDDNDIHQAQDTLRLIFKEDRKVGKINLSIKNDNGEIVYHETIETHYGDNVILIDLIDPRFNSKSLYRINVESESKQKFLLKFNFSW